MNKCAILHIPLSEYAYAEDEHTIRIRLRAEKYDLNKCCVFYEIGRASCRERV